MEKGASDKGKKTRECGFINVVDPKVKNELVDLMKPPRDATNFIFWFSKSNPEEWGLTIKSIPKKTDREGFPSQHTWKITWFVKDGTLVTANHCKSLANDCCDPAVFEKITEIYNSYKKK